jgi:hypothetical protein
VSLSSWQHSLDSISIQTKDIFITF